MKSIKIKGVDYKLNAEGHFDLNDANVQKIKLNKYGFPTISKDGFTFKYFPTAWKKAYYAYRKNGSSNKKIDTEKLFELKKFISENKLKDSIKLIDELINVSMKSNVNKELYKLFGYYPNTSIIIHKNLLMFRKKDGEKFTSLKELNENILKNNFKVYLTEEDLNKLIEKLIAKNFKVKLNEKDEVEYQE